MTSLNNALKSEIARVSRKELKDELATLRKASSLHRSEIAALKRELKSLRSLVKLSERTIRRAMPAPPAEPIERPARGGGFNANALAAKRAQLGLSQLDMARLLEASALSVSKWESGKVQPRAAQLGRILAVQRLGKRAALAQLAQQAAG
jgi:DNA-binding XRE family transcriptional regulator